MMKYFAINATSKVITDKVCVTLGASFYAGIAMDENGNMIEGISMILHMKLVRMQKSLISVLLTLKSGVLLKCRIMLKKNVQSQKIFVNFISIKVQDIMRQLIGLRLMY